MNPNSKLIASDDTFGWYTRPARIASASSSASAIEDKKESRASGATGNTYVNVRMLGRAVSRVVVVVIMLCALK